MGSDPLASLATARTDFEADRLSAAASAAADAFATRQNAEDVGQIRVLVGAGSLFIVTGGTLVVLRIRRRRTDMAEAEVSRSPSPEPADVPLDPTA
jgi:hypothetical protein